jgi:hypothetical protein
MKQIDKILEDLAASIGTEIEVFTVVTYYKFSFKDPLCCILPSDINQYNPKYITEMGRYITLMKSLLLSNIMANHEKLFFTERNPTKKFKLNLETLLFEPVEREEELLPCAACEERTAIKEHIPYFINDVRYFSECQNIHCSMCSPHSESKQEAIKDHNELYRKLHAEEKK